MACDKHAKEEFILSTVRQPRPPWHCDANREDHMTELDHEVVKGLCDHNATTTVEIYKQVHSLAHATIIKEFFKKTTTLQAMYVMYTHSLLDINSA